MFRTNIAVLITCTDEISLERKKYGLPCPACQKYLKNGATLKIHLKRHQLSCDFILDPLPLRSAEITPELVVQDIPVSAAIES